MYTEKDISIVVPSYNNLEYLKLMYKSVRDISKDVELIMFSDGCTDNTDLWIQSIEQTDQNVIASVFTERTGHTYLYDYGFQLSKRAIIGIIHADMVLHKNFFQNIIKYLNNNIVVCGTCVEPPLHPPGNEKHIFNAGLYPNEYNHELFNNFCNNLDTNKVSTGIFAPWFLLRDEYFAKINKHDSRFMPYGYEDADIFTRMKLAGFKFIQSRDAFVYHFTQRGHRWESGQIGSEISSYKEIMNKMGREYVRKFGTYPLFDKYHCPTPAPKYDIGFVIHNCSFNILNLVEPFSSNVYVDFELSRANLYIQNEKSVLDISKRVLPITSNYKNNIIIEFNRNNLDKNYIQLLNQFPSIIFETNDTGTFELDIFTVTIKSTKQEVIPWKVIN